MKAIGILVVLLVVAGVLAFGANFNRDVAPATDADGVVVEKETERLVIREELRDVHYCGKTVRAKQVFLDGADVVLQVIPFLENEGLCDFLALENAEVIPVTATFCDHTQEEYCVSLGSAFLYVDAKTLHVYEPGIDGLEFIGALSEPN